MSMGYCPAGYEDEDDFDDDFFLAGRQDSDDMQFNQNGNNIDVSNNGQAFASQNNFTSDKQNATPLRVGLPRPPPGFLKNRNPQSNTGVPDGFYDHPLSSRGRGSNRGNHTPRSNLYIRKERPRENDLTVIIDDFKAAVQINNIEAIRKCLDEGVDVDVIMRSGWTALMYAASFANGETVDFLLQKGANANFHKGNYSVLMTACASTKENEEAIVECVSHLIKFGANVNNTDRFHMTPLLYASRHGNTLAVKKLIECGANVNKQDNRGYTSLTWAANKGHVRIIQVLLENGCDIEKTCTDGSKAIDIAMANSQYKVAEMLKEYCKSDKSSSSLEEITANIATSESNNKQKDKLAEQGKEIQTQREYGDLELFLCGLELIDLVPTFREHQISFPTFLRMTDMDLQKLGIHQLGVRKKILDGIKDTHGKEWETKSLASIQYNKTISCPEAVAMVGNIHKHTAYIGSTIGYISDQIKAKESILQTGQEGGDVKVLINHTDTALANVRMLYQELSQLRIHLSKVTAREDYQPADLILKRKKRVMISRKRCFAMASSLLCLTGGILLWKYGDSLVDKAYQMISIKV